MREQYKEKELPSGEIMVLTSKGDHPRKPWQVACWAADGEHRWSKDFATQAEAEAEYVRFD
jgi:hypothetical protein